MPQLSILIVEDEPLVAEDIAGHLESIGFIVSGIAYSGKDAIQKLQEQRPDAVLLDVTLEGKMDGIDVAHHINEHYKIPFIFLTSHADKFTVERVKATKPGAYLVKPFDENDLFTSLEMAVSNYLLLHPEAKVITLDWINAKLGTPLSEREFEILQALKGGKSNAEVAASLFLSVNTIKTHLQNIYVKMSARNRTEALFILNQFMNQVSANE
jgi:DNA-binding NarL/FixJ family response regulator